MSPTTMTFKPCECDTCKADNNAPGRAAMGYEAYYFCTSHPDYVSICEWGEHLSGEECKQLTQAVSEGLVKRGQLQHLWERDQAFMNLKPEEMVDWDSFVASYPKWEGAK